VLRFASAGALLFAAAGMAFVATKSSDPLVANKSDQQRLRFNKFRQDPDKLMGNKVLSPGPGTERGPAAAAEEEYAKRAYPGTDIPFPATVNAQAAFNRAKGRGVGNGRKSTGQWSLVGPSTANFPPLLTFSGAPYTTSGRVTAIASEPTCSPNHCRVWIAAAGGGIWRTDKALSGNGVSWTFVSGSFATNAIGALTYDANSNTLYAGTGEPNVSVDSEAGVGIYKSTDGGDTWTKLADLVTNLDTNSPQGPNGNYTGDAFDGRAIQRIAVDPNNSSILFVASARGVRGVSSTDGGPTGNPPTARPPYGVFKSTDGGATFSFVWDGNFTNRGAIDLAIDPSNSNIVYATAFNQGTFRSADAGTTWTQIKARLTANDPDRPSIAVTMLPNGKTRLYLGEGAAGSPAARVFRTDDAAVASPVFIDLTTSQNIGYCSGQCWYDNVVYTPAGKPDVLYVGGSFDYGNYGFRNNGRAFLYSTNAGASFSDVTWDATTNPPVPGSYASIYPGLPYAPNGMHPDQHAVLELPGSNSAIFGSDGGVTRTSGQFADVSSQCSSRQISGADLVLCQQLLSRVPTYLYSLNKGLSTLQFQSLSVGPDNPKHLQGGTQDNGTFETTGSAVVWPQIIYGDGGQSGFSATNSTLRFNTFSGQGHAANFRDGDPTKWVDIGGPMANSPEGSYFYPPIMSDPNPANAQTIYEGSFSVWRTQDWGGSQSFLEANCNDFLLSSVPPTCGDFVPLGPAGATDLTAVNYGADRTGGAVAWIARAPSDTGTIWAATGTGRVFVTKNGDAAAGSVTWTRIDSLPSATADPGRFITNIFVDPANPNHAWISYSGYNFNTPSQPGHVFEVTYNPATPDATWTNIDGGTGPMGDLPVTSIVYDNVTGDLYAGTDFGVLRLPASTSTWLAAGSGLPNVEICGLTIVPSARLLYAATHGRSAWSLKLP